MGDAGTQGMKGQKERNNKLIKIFQLDSRTMIAGLVGATWNIMKSSLKQIKFHYQKEECCLGEV